MRDRTKTKKQLTKGQSKFKKQLAASDNKRKWDIEELELMAQLLDDATDSIFLSNDKGELVYINKTACLSRGYSREELLKMNVRQLVPAENQQFIEQNNKKLREKGEGIWETSHLKKDGSVMPVEIHGRVIKSGDIELVLTIVRNITERKQAEEELIRLKSVLDATTDFVSIADTSGKLLYINSEGRRMLGIGDDEDVAALSTNDIHPKWVNQILQEEADPAVFSKGIWRGETALLTRDGKEIPVSQVCMAQRDPSREMMFLSTIARDITEQKLNEEELLKDLFDNLAVGIYITQEGKFQMANPRFQQITGCREQELLGKDIVDFTYIEDRSTVRKSAIEMLKGQQSSAYEYRYITRSGEIKWGTESVAPIMYKGKRATLGSFMDITENKKKDEQILRSSRLASIGELAAGVAHEINNPLTGVIGYAQLLSDRDDAPADMKEDLNRIYQESHRAVRIVQSLLRFARQHKSAKELQDINDLIKKTLELRSYDLRTENITIDFNLEPDISYVLADYNQIQQVILNLIVNAQQALAEVKRKGKIAIDTKSVNGHVILSISDNGPGIAKEDINNIFNPFFTTKPVGEGSGLGLSVCHGIIIEHGGNIYVESEQGKGATFTIELPVADEDQVLETKKEITLKRKKASNKKEKGSILVIDDEPAIRDILVRTLATEGHQVNTAESGDAALNRMAAVYDDIYIVDLKMPGMGGIQFYKKVEKIYPDLAPKIIFITGDTVGPDTQRFFMSTGRPYLMKPFAYVDLINLVDKILRGS